jgi:plastocyanin
VYEWWVFVHLAGVFGFLISHGVSISVTFQLRSERDPAKVNSLLQLSGSSIRAFYASLFVLLLGGVVAGFIGDWWSYGWIWLAIVILIVTSLAMLAMARPYYRRVGFVARAMADGSQAVTREQFDSILRSRRPDVVAAIGVVGLVAILYLMIFKPSLGLSGAAAPPPPTGPVVNVTAKVIKFDQDTLTAPAGAAFSIVFDNQDAGVEHNVAIYTDSSRADDLFVGQRFIGPRIFTYEVTPLPAGSYFFVCDVHPDQMTGTFTVG